MTNRKLEKALDAVHDAVNECTYASSELANALLDGPSQYDFDYECASHGMTQAKVRKLFKDSVKLEVKHAVKALSTLRKAIEKLETLLPDAIAAKLDEVGAMECTPDLEYDA